MKRRDLLMNSTFIHLLAVRVLEGSLSITDVPEMARPQVEEVLGDTDLLVDIYISRIMNFKQSFETIPESLKPLVEVRMNEETTNFNLYVAQIIDGLITLNEVPEQIRERVRSSAEYFLGKKLD